MAEIIKETQVINDLAASLVSRTQEVYAYDANIQSYNEILSSTASALPDRLAYLNELSDEQAIAQCPIDDITILAEVQQHKRVSYLIRTEAIERAKANSILNAIESQLDSILDPEQKDLVIQETLDRLQGTVS